MKLEDFMNASPVNFFAVETIKKCLTEAGYKEWKAGEPCPEVKSGDKLFSTKNGSAIFAFHMARSLWPRVACASFRHIRTAPASV